MRILSRSLAIESGIAPEIQFRKPATATTQPAGFLVGLPAKITRGQEIGKISSCCRSGAVNANMSRIN